MTYCLFVGGYADGDRKWFCEDVPPERITIPECISAPQYFPILKETPIEDEIIRQHIYKRESLSSEHGKHYIFVAENLKPGDWIIEILVGYKRPLAQSCM